MFGSPGDRPVPGEYDGSRGTDYAVWRPSTGAWISKSSATGITSAPVQWGYITDVPTTAKFCSDTVSRTAWARRGIRRTVVAQRCMADGWPDQPQARRPGRYPAACELPGRFRRRARGVSPSNGRWYRIESSCDRFASTRALVDAAATRVRGITVAAVKNGEIVMTHGAGMANATTPAGPDVPWQIASISKLLIGTAMMGLIDDGVLDPEVIFEPNALVNPINGQAPLMLDFANHTSGVSGNGCFGRRSDAQSRWPRALSAEADPVEQSRTRHGDRVHHCRCGLARIGRRGQWR